ncbi:MAG: type III-B CRISPR module RAMP protein Cmr6 [Candidatus Rokuibacteriota bacterium]
MNARRNEPIHPGLLLTRFVRWPGRRDLHEWTLGEYKRNILCEVGRVANGESVATFARAWLARRGVWLNPLKDQGFASTFPATTGWRLAIGLAGASPLETSIVLHHVFGVPMLPGSGLKGLALATARDWLKVNQEEYLDVFGTRNAAGLVDVLDAIPIPRAGEPLLEIDVMNAHYPKWYRKETDQRGRRIPPSDDQNPNPVFFLTVPAEVEFDFALLCRTRTDRAKEALSKACEWLRTGLTELGAGAKTAAGYGYFTE